MNDEQEICLMAHLPLTKHVVGSLPHRRGSENCGIFFQIFDKQAVAHRMAVRELYASVDALLGLPGC